MVIIRPDLTNCRDTVVISLFLKIKHGKYAHNEIDIPQAGFSSSSLYVCRQLFLFDKLINEQKCNDH